jgi:hypothetical protein
MSQEVKSNGPSQDGSTPSPARGRGGRGGFRGGRGRDGQGRGGFQNQAMAGRKDHEASPGIAGQRGTQSLYQARRLVDDIFVLNVAQKRCED